MFDVRREDGFLEVVQAEKMLRDFRTYDSSLVMTKLLYAKLQDGRPTFNFDDSRCLSFGLKMNRSGTSPQCTHVEGTWFDGLISFFGVFKGLRGIGSDGGT